MTTETKVLSSVIRRNLYEYFDRADEGEVFIVEHRPIGQKESKPRAVLMSFEEYEKLKGGDRS